MGDKKGYKSTSAEYNTKEYDEKSFQRTKSVPVPAVYIDTWENQNDENPVKKKRENKNKIPKDIVYKKEPTSSTYMEIERKTSNRIKSVPTPQAKKKQSSENIMFKFKPAYREKNESTQLIRKTPYSGSKKREPSFSIKKQDTKKNTSLSMNQKNKIHPPKRSLSKDHKRNPLKRSQTIEQKIKVIPLKRSQTIDQKMKVHPKKSTDKIVPKNMKMTPLTIKSSQESSKKSITKKEKFKKNKKVDPTEENSIGCPMNDNDSETPSKK